MQSAGHLTVVISKSEHQEKLPWLDPDQSDSLIV